MRKTQSKYYIVIGEIMRYFLSVFNFGFIAYIIGIRKKKLWDPLVVFSVFWGLIIFLASLQLFNLYPISRNVYIMFELGFVSFVIGYGNWSLIGDKFKIKELSKFGKGTYAINYKLINVSIAGVSAFFVYRLKDYFSLVRQGYSGEELRYMFFEYEPTNALGKYISYIQMFIATPIVYAAVILVVIDFFEGKRQKFFLINTLVMIAIYIVISGGRVIILNTAFHVIFILLIKSRLHLLKLLLKYKKILISMGISCVVLFMLLNAKRGNENSGSELLKQIYVYYTGCMQHFEKRIDMLGNHRDHGVSFFAGYFRPVLLVLSKVGFSVPDNYEVFMSYNSTLQSGVQIGPDVWYNAYVSMNYHFYLSFGVFGIFLGNFMYGSIASSLYLKVKRESENILNTAVLMLLLQGILTSMIRWQFVIPAYALAFIYIRAFLTKTSESNYNFIKRMG